MKTLPLVILLIAGVSGFVLEDQIVKDGPQKDAFALKEVSDGFAGAVKIKTKDAFAILGSEVPSANIPNEPAFANTGGPAFAGEEMFAGAVKIKTKDAFAGAVKIKTKDAFAVVSEEGGSASNDVSSGPVRFAGAVKIKTKDAFAGAVKIKTKDALAVGCKLTPKQPEGDTQFAIGQHGGMPSRFAGNTDGVAGDSGGPLGCKSCFTVA